MAKRTTTRDHDNILGCSFRNRILPDPSYYIYSLLLYFLDDGYYLVDFIGTTFPSLGIYRWTKKKDNPFNIINMPAIIAPDYKELKNLQALRCARTNSNKNDVTTTKRRCTALKTKNY